MDLLPVPLQVIGARENSLKTDSKDMCGCVADSPGFIPGKIDLNLLRHYCKPAGSLVLHPRTDSGVLVAPLKQVAPQ